MACPRRFARFRLHQLMLVVLLCAILIALGQFATWAYRDYQLRLGEQRKQRNITEYLRQLNAVERD